MDSRAGIAHIAGLQTKEYGQHESAADNDLLNVNNLSLDMTQCLEKRCCYARPVASTEDGEQRPVHVSDPNGRGHHR